MAGIQPTVTTFRGNGDGSLVLVQWTPVTEVDTCVEVQLPEYADKSVQVAGTIGGSSTAVHGSNDGTNFALLRDPGGAPIAITAAGIKQVLENTLMTKPVITGGSSQNLTVTMLFRLANPLRT